MKWFNIEWLKKKLSERKVGKAVGFSYWHLLTVMGERIKVDNIINNARSIAFSFTLSVFPAIIFIFAIIPYLVSIPMFSDINFLILNYLKEILPLDTYKVILTTILEILKYKNFGLLSFGFLLALYFVTNGIINMIATFNMVYATKKTRGYLKDGFVAMVITIIVATTFLITISIIGTSTHYFHVMMKYFNIQNEYSFAVYIIQLLGTYMLFLISIASIYILAPSVKVKWKFFSVGAIFASALCLIITILFTLYVNNFNTYNKLYGSLGAIISFMVWIWLLSLSLLVGYELNACIQLAQRKHEQGIIEKIKNIGK